MKFSNLHRRLMGQIQDYEPGTQGWVFVVICGEDFGPKFLSNLRLKYRGKDFISISHKKGKRDPSRIM